MKKNTLGIMPKSPEIIIKYIDENEITHDTLIDLLFEFNIMRIETLNTKLLRYVLNLVELKNENGELKVVSVDENFNHVIEILKKCECLDISKFLKIYNLGEMQIEVFFKFLKINKITKKNSQARKYFAIAKYCSENIPYYMELNKKIYQNKREKGSMVKRRVKIGKYKK